MKYTIEIAENGFILTLPGMMTETGQEDPIVKVFEGENEEAFAKLATELSYELVKPYDKFKSDNIKITWDGKGHKVE